MINFIVISIVLCIFGVTNKKIMKSIFKITLLIALVTLSSCSKEDAIMPVDPVRSPYYEYNADQPVTLDVVIIPTEGVELQYDLMEEEANADYYHRWGIHLNFSLGERLDIDEKYGPAQRRVFLPTNYNGRKEIYVYVLPEDHVHFNAFGYAVLGHGNIIVREDAQDRSTLAHEIGHVLGLGHNDELEYNLMATAGSVKFDALPKNLVEEQLDTIAWNFHNHVKDVNAMAKQPQIVFDEIKAQPMGLSKLIKQ